MQAKTITPGYQLTSGAWIALTPDLQLIPTPPEMVLAKLEEDTWDPETASQAGAYQTKALLRWLEYHHQCVSSGTFYNMRILLRMHNNKSIIITIFEFP